jgi:hypothetical protein
MAPYFPGTEFNSPVKDTDNAKEAEMEAMCLPAKACRKGTDPSQSLQRKHGAATMVVFFFKLLASRTVRQ